MKTKYKSVFISDLHLGSRGCNASELNKFLSEIECEHLILVGDIIDGWRLTKKWYWPKSHSKIVSKIIRIAKKTKVTYITGNHDEFLRTIKNIKIGSIEVLNRCEHIGIDGKRYLVCHGDMFDHLMRTRSGRMVMHLGDRAYDLLILLNKLVNYTRSLFNLPNWSLAKFLKKKAKKAANYIGNFEDQMIEYCRKQGYDGIICGHIHNATIRELDGITYMNDGDWCESCTALVEHYDGKWEIISYV